MATVSYEVDGVTNVIFFDATMNEQHAGSSEITEHDVERGADLADHVKASRPALSLTVFVTNTPIQSIGRLLGQKVPMTLGTYSNQQVFNDHRSEGTINLDTRPPKITPGYVAPFLTPAGTGALVSAFRDGVGGDGLRDGGPRIAYPPVVTPGRYSANRAVSILVDVFTFLEPRDRLQDVWTALSKLRVDATPLLVATRLQDYPGMLIANVGGMVEARDAIEFQLTFKQVGFSESVVFSEVDRVADNAKKAQAKKDQGPKATFGMTRERPQSIVDMAAAEAAGYETPDEVLARHPNPTAKNL